MHHGPTTQARVAARCATAGLLLAAGALAPGCMAKSVRTPVFDQNGVEVYLRQQTRGGEGVDRGFTHPVTIAPARLTNILARIEVRGEDKDAEREPAISSGVIFAIGEGASKALAKADPSQEVVVMAQEQRRSLGIFTNSYLTSLILWVKDDRLFIHLGAVDEVMSRDPRDKPQEPQLDKIASTKKVLPGDGFAPQGPRLIAAAWRDEVFRDAGLRVRAGGDVVRRTILLESEVEPEGPEADKPAPPPEDLSPEALRALADLEEERRRGELTEADYQMRRRDILAGKLPQPMQKPAAGEP